MKPTPEPKTHRQYLRSPSDMALELKEFHDLQKSMAEAGFDRRITFGIPAIDSVVRSMFAGTLTTFLGRPSHGKSFTAKFLAARRLKLIRAAGLKGPRVVFVTLEEDHRLVYMTMAEMTTRYEHVMAQTQDIDLFDMEIMSKGIDLPLWLITDTPNKPVLSLEKAAKFTVQEMARQLDQALRDFTGTHVDSIFVDYAQLFPAEGKWGDGDSKVTQVMQIVEELRLIGRLVKAPVVMCAQAQRGVDGRTYPIPAMGDAQWASSIEQYSDVMFGCAMPNRWSRATTNQGMQLGGREWSARELETPMMVLRLLKQRLGRGTGEWMLQPRFDTGILEEVASPDLNEDFTLQ